MGLCTEGTIPSDVLLAQKELRGQIVIAGRVRVIHRHRLDAREHNVLGDFDADAAHAANEHVGRLHAAHRLVAEHVQLARVEALVDVAVGCICVVDIHGGGVRGHAVGVEGEECVVGSCCWCG